MDVNAKTQLEALPGGSLPTVSKNAVPDQAEFGALGLAHDQATVGLKAGNSHFGVALLPPDPGVQSFSRSQGAYAVDALFEGKAKHRKLSEATVVLNADQAADKQSRLRINRLADGQYVARIVSGNPPQERDPSTSELKQFRSAIQSLFADADKEGLVVSMVPGVPNGVMAERPKRDALLYYLQALPQAPKPEEPRQYALKYRPNPMVGGVSSTLFKKDNKTARLAVSADFDSRIPNHPLNKASVVTNPSAPASKRVEIIIERNAYGELVGRAFIGGKERPFTLDDVGEAWNAIRETYRDQPKVCNALLYDLERIKDYPLPD